MKKILIISITILILLLIASFLYIVLEVNQDKEELSVYASKTYDEFIEKTNNIEQELEREELSVGNTSTGAKEEFIFTEEKSIKNEEKRIEVTGDGKIYSDEELKIVKMEVLSLLNNYKLEEAYLKLEPYIKNGDFSNNEDFEELIYNVSLLTNLIYPELDEIAILSGISQIETYIPAFLYIDYQKQKQLIIDKESNIIKRRSDFSIVSKERISGRDFLRIIGNIDNKIFYKAVIEGELNNYELFFYQNVENKTLRLIRINNISSKDEGYFSDI